jgi:DNA-binding GntR family transcriptional regulator
MSEEVTQSGRRASDRAYATLRAEIIDSRLPAGTVLAEVEQAERLGISRTPLREALSRLHADGLVASHPGRGVIVTELSGDDVTELFELREALEMQAARLAARRRDREVFEGLRDDFGDVHDLLHDERGYYDLVSRFDAAIDRAAGNPSLVRALNGVRTHVARVRRLPKNDVPRLADAAREHLQIVDAILDGDELLAASATQIHLRNSLRNVLASLPQHTALHEKD